MDSEYGAVYEDLYHRHWWWQSREKLIANVLKRFRPGNGWDGILDVGCGNGLSFELLSRFGRSVFGIEIDRRLVDDDGPHRKQIHVGPLDDTYEAPCSFSLITLLDVLEHIEDPVSVLRRVKQVATTHANVLITVPAFEGLWTSHDTMNEHYKRYTKQSLAHLARDADLEILHTEYFFHWVAPVKLVLRLKERLAGPSRSPVPQLPGSVVNRALYTISRMEQMAPPVLRPPFGSSLLLMGKF